MFGKKKSSPEGTNANDTSNMMEFADQSVHMDTLHEQSMTQHPDEQSMMTAQQMMTMSMDASMNQDVSGNMY